MRLEVLVDEQEPLIFPLNKEKIIIGSGEICDILLDAEGISRKHLILHCSEDEFFIVDQGSTNGTFINEERVIPGRRIEFTSFFPVRLGESVLLTLLSDDESEDFEVSSFNTLQKEIALDLAADSDSTRVIKLTDLQREPELKIHRHKNKASVRAKNIARGKVPGKKARRPQPEPEKKFNMIFAGCIILVLGAIYYHLNSADSLFEIPQVAVVNSTDSQERAPDSIEVISKVSPDHFASADAVEKLQLDFKCISELEVELCQFFDLSAPYGVTQSGMDLYVFAPAYIDDDYRQKLSRVYNSEIGETIPEKIYALYFLLTHLPNLDDKLSGFRIHVHLLNEENQAITAVSFYKEGYEKLREKTAANLLSDIITSGPSVMEFTNDYLSYH